MAHTEFRSNGTICGVRNERADGVNGAFLDL